jgi:hypothetical protein
MCAARSQFRDRDKTETTSSFDTQFSKSEMVKIGLKLRISILKAVLAVCRLTGESLRSRYDECTEEKALRAIFAEWTQIRQIGFEAQEALDELRTH